MLWPSICKGAWAERRWGCCTESLFGGWLHGQRPYSWDGPLPSREGLHRGDGRLPERRAGPNIGTAKERKPTLLYTEHYTYHQSMQTFSIKRWNFILIECFCNTGGELFSDGIEMCLYCLKPFLSSLLLF